MFGNTSSMLRGGYIIYIHFDDAPGVSQGTPVRKSGILIGRVHSVRFADQGGVIVEARINRGIELYRREIPEVTSSLLGGDVVIQFVQRSKTVPTEPLAPPAPGNDKQGRHGPKTTLTAQKSDESKTPAAKFEW